MTTIGSKFLGLGSVKPRYVFSFAILRTDRLSMHYAASAQQNKRLTLGDVLKMLQHTGAVNKIYIGPESLHSSS